MKTFSKFIDEASRFIIAPSKRAKMLGLKGDGHGGWYHRGTHEFEAKTDSRQPLGLKFFNKNHTQVVGGKDAPSKGREGQIASRSWVAEQQLPPEQLPPEQLPPEQLPVEELPPPNYLPVEKTKGILTIAFGGFNPFKPVKRAAKSISKGVRNIGKGQNLRWHNFCWSPTAV